MKLTESVLRKMIQEEIENLQELELDEQGLQEDSLEESKLAGGLAAVFMALGIPSAEAKELEGDLAEQIYNHAQGIIARLETPKAKAEAIERLIGEIVTSAADPAKVSISGPKTSPPPATASSRPPTAGTIKTTGMMDLSAPPPAPAVRPRPRRK